MLASGQALCHQMRCLNAHGESVGKVTPAVVDVTGWDFDKAVNFVAITMADLCPELKLVPVSGVTPTVLVPPPYRDGD